MLWKKKKMIIMVALTRLGDDHGRGHVRAELDRFVVRRNFQAEE